MAVRAEMAAGSNVNACNASKWTALHRAVERNHSDVVKVGTASTSRKGGLVLL